MFIITHGSVSNKLPNSTLHFDRVIGLFGFRNYVKALWQAVFLRQQELLVYPEVRCRLSTFSLNDFFSETTWPILMKLYRNDPCMVLYQSCSKKLNPQRIVVAKATERNIFANLCKFSSLKLQGLELRYLVCSIM